MGTGSSDREMVPQAPRLYSTSLGSQQNVERSGLTPQFTRAMTMSNGDVRWGKWFSLCRTCSRIAWSSVNVETWNKVPRDLYNRGENERRSFVIVDPILCCSWESIFIYWYLVQNTFF